MREHAWLGTVLSTLDDCTEKQRTVYLLAVGLEPDGTHRPPLQLYEIAALLSISKQAARFRFIEADAKVSRALFMRALDILRSST